ncbi:NUDIX hydrolase [Hominiventricola filiformis]|uniref:NUDIX hydrolase n=1 Tax=Hominiventricola filiformis TaxID=2885352 RepID=A0AAE3A900_9FIRM|nr:NUDIX hydrolase [Hominiventricola filiformis]MCC2125648.1 NUDIX hydrolase [Hominiventricola filiformis]MCI6881175.1 NUDIX hydrolase [Clostridiaceae bacterium]QUO21718.1 NUDIX hydrolase [Clostridiaceae bacterium Marseille-Q4143]RHU86308.1 NUDIX hydrolase [Clostridiaceae bacterium OM08-6BH]
MEKHDHILSVEKKTDNRFLNMYDLQYENKVGGQGIYHIASRGASIEELKLKTHKNKPDGVIIYALYGPKRDKVVMVRQYRFSVDDYVYEFPAGLVDAGETYGQAGARELKEETGLDFTPVKADEMYSKPLFTTIGMTDESCATVYGYASGKISKEGLEDNEDLEVIIADRKEVRRILKEENVSINCGYLLMHFLCHTTEDPFYFLR